MCAKTYACDIYKHSTNILFFPHTVAKPAAVATAAAQPPNNNNNSNSKKKSKEEYQQVVLSLSEMFPDEEINLLTAAALLASGRIHFLYPA